VGISNQFREGNLHTYKQKDPCGKFKRTKKTSIVFPYVKECSNNKFSDY